MTWLFALLRVVFGLVFIAASVGKLLHPAEFAQIIVNYQLLPDMLVNPLALYLPWLELVCGAALVTNTFVRGASAVLNFLLLVFLATLWFNVSRGLDISCGCFTVNPQAQGGMIDSAVRDTAFFALGLVVMVRAFLDARRRNSSAALWRDLRSPRPRRGRAGLAVDVPAPTVKDGVLIVGMAAGEGARADEAAAEAGEAVAEGVEAVVDSGDGAAWAEEAVATVHEGEAIAMGPVEEAGAVVGEPVAPVAEAAPEVIEAAEEPAVEAEEPAMEEPAQAAGAVAEPVEGFAGEAPAGEASPGEPAAEERPAGEAEEAPAAQFVDEGLESPVPLPDDGRAPGAAPAETAREAVADGPAGDDFIFETADDATDDAAAEPAGAQPMGAAEDLTSERGGGEAEASAGEEEFTFEQAQDAPAGEEGGDARK